MKVAIFGVRDGEYVLERLREEIHGDECIISLSDNDKNKQGKTVSGKEVVDPEKLKQMYLKGEVDTVWIAIRNGYNRYSIVSQLQKAGIKNLSLIKPSVLTYRLPLGLTGNAKNPCSKQIVDLVQIEKPIIYYLEVHAMDSCNLNCKGCLHYSSLYPANEYPDLDRLLEDIKYLSVKTQIFQLRVLGGEPLLNPNLKKFLKELREILPETDLSVVSNGILIPKQDKELFNIMRECEIGFNLTLYPPTRHMKDVIYKVLNENRVHYGSHLAKIDEFSKNLSLKEQSRVDTAYKHCISRDSLFLREGKLYKCPCEALINRFYDEFHIPMHMESGLNIYDPSIEWEKTLVHMCEYPGNLCRYCSDVPQPYQWEIATNPKMEDWLIDE